MNSVYTFFKCFTSIFLLAVVLTAIWFLFKWYSDPTYKISEMQKGEILEVEDVKSSHDKNDRKIKIITYNMGFAAGPMQQTLADEHPEAFYRSNLDQIISIIKGQEANVVLLQEVDIDSKRSWYLNQLKYLMSRLDFKYAAPVQDWDMFFPLRKERKITKATVVISKFPILSNDYTLTSAKPNFENTILNIFYYPLLWESCMQRVSLDVGGEILDIYNVHLCVWNRDTRVAQTEYVTDWINSASVEHPYILGGDFNFHAYIRGTPVPEKDMAKEPFLNIIWHKLSGVQEVLAQKNDSISKIHEYYTFPERNHRYDFIYYSKGLQLENGAVLKPADASDHLPVSADFRLTGK